MGLNDVKGSFVEVFPKVASIKTLAIGRISGTHTLDVELLSAQLKGFIYYTEMTLST